MSIFKPARILPQSAASRCPDGTSHCYCLVRFKEKDGYIGGPLLACCSCSADREPRDEHYDHWALNDVLGWPIPEEFRL